MISILFADHKDYQTSVLRSDCGNTVVTMTVDHDCPEFICKTEKDLIDNIMLFYPIGPVTIQEIVDKIKPYGRVTIAIYYGGGYENDIRLEVPISGAMKPIDIPEINDLLTSVFHRFI